MISSMSLRMSLNSESNPPPSGGKTPSKSSFGNSDESVFLYEDNGENAPVRPTIWSGIAKDTELAAVILS